MTNETISVGDLVRFRDVVDPGDETARFLVVELRGPRVLLELVCDLPIRPTQAVLLADVAKA